MTWDCSVEYKNKKIRVAPVYRNKMVVVDNLNSKTLDVTLERCLTSKRNGGQANSVESINRINENYAIVTFKTYEGKYLFIIVGREMCGGRGGYCVCNLFKIQLSSTSG